jgi:T5SS/PEP-CTERM-associated repeat protein
MASETYTGAGAGLWSDPADWSGDAPPTQDAGALFTGGITATVGGDGVVNTIMVLGDADVTFTGTVTVHGWGSGNGFMVCDGAMASFAPGSALDTGGLFQVGFDDPGALAADGAALSTADAVIGRLAPAIGSVTLDGSTWSDAGDLTVGAAGTGTLDAAGGSRLSVGGNLYLGTSAGASGQVTLSGGTAMTVAKAAFIGLGGTGTLRVDADSSFQAGTLLRIGDGGSLVLAGGSVAAEGTSPVSCAAGISIMGGGTISGFGTLATAADGQFHDNGLIAADGGTLKIDATVVGLGAMRIDAASTVAITGALRLTGGVYFAGAGAALDLAHGAAVAAVLSGFAAGDSIAMAGIDQAAWNQATGVLTLSEAGHTVDRLQLAGSYGSDSFMVTQAGGVGVVSVTA